MSTPGDKNGQIIISSPTILAPMPLWKWAFSREAASCPARHGPSQVPTGNALGVRMERLLPCLEEHRFVVFEEGA